MPMSQATLAPKKRAATWTPAALANIQTWLPFANSYAAFAESGIAKTPISLGGYCGTVFDAGKLATMWATASDVSRPVVTDVGATPKVGLDFSAGVCSLACYNSKSAYKFLWTTKTWSIWFRCRVTSATTGGVILDNNTGTTANTGIYIGHTTANKLQIIIVKSVGGTACIVATTTGTIGTSWTDVLIYGDGTSIKVSIGGAAAETFSYTSALGTGAGTNELYYGSASNSTSKFPGLLGDLVITSGNFTAEELTKLRAYNPSLGSRSFSYATASTATLTPAQVYPCERWYDFSDQTSLFADTGRAATVAADGDAVALIANKSLGIATDAARDGTQSTAGSRPLYKTGIKNSLSAGLFDGTDDSLTIPSVPTDGNYHIFVVAKNSDATYGSRWLSNSPSGPYLVTTGSGYVGGADYMAAHTSAGAAQSNATHVPNDWNVWEVWQDENTVYCQCNGQGVGSGDATGGTFAANLLGGAVLPEWFADGYIGEVSVHTTKLSAAHATAIRNGLMTKWGIS